MLDWLATRSQLRGHCVTFISVQMYNLISHVVQKRINEILFCFWTDDNFPDDAHYSIRMIRITVCEIME